MNYAQGAREEAAFYYSNPMPMKGYTSPEEIAIARANAAYYNQHPGGMRGWADSGLEGLGDLLTDKNTLLYAALGAALATYLLPKKYRVGSKFVNAGVGAVAAVAVSRFM